MLHHRDLAVGRKCQCVRSGCERRLYRAGRARRQGAWQASEVGADASRRPAVRLVSLAVMRTYPIGGGFGRRLSSGLPPVELLNKRSNGLDTP
jgi:hypothetical protein